MKHLFPCVVGVLVALSPWLFMLWLARRLSSDRKDRSGTTIDDWILRGGKEQ